MRQLLSIVFCLSFLLLTEIGFAETTKIKKDDASQAERAQVQQAYHDWLKAVASAKGDPKGVVALYAPNAILLPTLSPEIKLNYSDDLSKELFDFSDADIKDYFVKFTSLKDLHGNTQSLYTQLLDDVAINTGLYTFVYIDDKGKTIDVPARFTFVYEKINGKWMIINHHSSYLPGQ